MVSTVAIVVIVLHVFIVAIIAAVVALAVDVRLRVRVLAECIKFRRNYLYPQGGLHERIPAAEPGGTVAQATCITSFGGGSKSSASCTSKSKSSQPPPPSKSKKGSTKSDRDGRKRSSANRKCSSTSAMSAKRGQPSDDEGSTPILVQDEISPAYCDDWIDDEDEESMAATAV